MIVPPKIVFLIKGLGLGGAERVMLQTAQYLRRQGHGISVINIDPRFYEMMPLFEEAGIRITNIPMTGLLAPFGFIRLCIFINKQNTDIVLAHLPVAGVAARLSGWLTNRPVLYVEHSIVSSYRFVTRLLNRMTYRLNSAVIAVSNAVERSINQTCKRSDLPAIHVIPNGIDYDIVRHAITDAQMIRRKLGIADDSFVFGTVASLRPVKRVDLLIHAFERLSVRFPGIRLLIVGGGDQMEPLKDLVMSLGLNHMVIFTGWQEHALPYMAAMDTYVICSEWEGLPLALLEAMALKKPVIASAVGGITDVIYDGINGLLIPADDKRALLAAMEKLLVSPEYRNSLAARACIDAERHWNFEQSAQKIESILISLFQHRKYIHNDI